MRRWSFAKGHGTQNDFVIVLDREGMLDITPADVRFLCDRRAGIGGDGLLRVVQARHIEGWTGAGSQWFMDYRNSDGSVAEMCGNGVRVFVRYLLAQDLAIGPVVPVGTRDGTKEATVLADGRIRVAMGPVRVGEDGIEVSSADGQTFTARAADVGNPHAVSFTDDLASLRLDQPPQVWPAHRFPDGVNLEFIQRIDDHRLRMRVHERGSGETRSCGTGTVAAAAVAAGGRDGTYHVEVLGGTVEVELTGGQAHLTGPAVIVAHGEVTLPADSALQKE